MRKTLAIFSLLALVATSLAEVIVIDPPRTAGEVGPRAEAAAKAFNRVAANLTRLSRQRLAAVGRYHSELPFTMPVTVFVRGQQDRHPYAGGDITLQFDGTGSRSFPTAYRALLEDTFAAAKNTMSVVFGPPNNPGVVRVLNYDADIADRDAVSGGIYVVNGAQRDIRFPVYSSPEAAAVNFVHCLLLAYQGDQPWPTDAQQEGLVRAAVMKVVRTPGAMPVSLDADLLEAALSNTYDVGAWYDWYNQPGLTSSRFIAPNLRNTDLPIGGSVGGPYLLRYQMAGTAWQKLVAENSGFIAELNRRYYLDPNVALPANFSAACQAALDTVTGTANSVIEGNPFDGWLARQYDLQARDLLGQKVIVQPTPLAPISGSGDFGVFDVAVHWFEVQTGGNEILLSGSGYPIFWDNTFNRLFPSAQEDRMDLGGGYGSVTPNLPNLNAGAPYRCAIDMPLGDRLQRTYVPAGSIATGTSTTPNNFYGTVVGLSLPSGATARVRVTFGLVTFDNCPIVNGAFGATIAASQFAGYQRLTVEVVRTQNSVDTVVYTRKVNKGPGELALDLRINGELNFAPSGGLTKGISLLGVPVSLFVQDQAAVFGLNPDQVLAARWNSSRSKYDLYPDCGGLTQGTAMFLRLPAAQPGFFAPGSYSPGTPSAVALRPGWNLVSTPLPEAVTTNRIRVVRGADFPVDWSDAVGNLVGVDFFAFTPGAADAVTGVPETGTFGPATQFNSGQGYFVRCLAPEGATLLFEPANPLFRGGGPNVGDTQPDGWLLRAAVTKNNRTAVAFMGGARDATRNMDARFDSPLPPKAVDGLQIAVEGSRFRDVRSFFSNETFKVRFDGLVPGESYDVRLIAMKGDPGTFDVYDTITRKKQTLRAPAVFRFTATRPFRWLEISTKGRVR